MKPNSGFESPPPDIATQAELIQRLEARATPKPVPQLTPDGPVTALVQSLVAQSNEQRIRELEGTFKSARHKLEADHSFSRLDGYAREHFQHHR